MMMEVCERFPKIGTIKDYLDLSPGERVLYDAFTRMKLENEAKRMPLFGGKK